MTDAITDDIKRVAAQLGRTPTKTDYLRHGRHSLTEIRSCHRTWKHALTAAGLTRQQLTDDQILQSLKAAAEQHGRMLSARQINQHPDLPSVSLLLKRFGTLDNARRSAGITEPAPNPNQGASTERILDLGVILACDLGRLPAFNDWAHARSNGIDLPSEWQVYRRFGGDKGAWRLFQYYLLEELDRRGIALDDGG